MINVEGFFSGSVIELHPCIFGYGPEWSYAKQMILNDDICIWYHPVDRHTVTIERIKLPRYYQYRVAYDLGVAASQVYRVEIDHSMGEYDLIATQVGNNNAGIRIWNRKGGAPHG